MGKMLAIYGNLALFVMDPETTTHIFFTILASMSQLSDNFGAQPNLQSFDPLESSFKQLDLDLVREILV